MRKRNSVLPKKMLKGSVRKLRTPRVKEYSLLKTLREKDVRQRKLSVLNKKLMKT